MIKASVILFTSLFLLISSIQQAGATDKWVISYDSTADVIARMVVYDGRLYATGSDELESNLYKAYMYVYDGNKWSQSYDVLEARLSTLAVYDNKLYTGGLSLAGDTYQNGTIYAYDGGSWTQNHYFPQIVTSLAAYRDELYAGTGADIYVFDGNSWSLSYSPEKSFWVRSLAVYNDKLYASTDYTYTNGNIYVYDGNSWTVNSHFESTILSLMVYDGKLYAGTAPEGIIYVYDGVSWNVSYNTPTYGIAALKVHNNVLYASALKQDTVGSDGIIYSYDGSSWTKDADELGLIASLEGYNNKLYAGTFSDGIVYERASTSFLVICDGCFNEKSCIPFGTRMAGMNGTGSYCDVANKALEPQKNDAAVCQNDYECISNYCSNGVCGNLQKELQGIRGLLQAIIDFLKSLFGKFSPGK